MEGGGWQQGLEAFLTAYCPAPEQMRLTLGRIGLPARVNWLEDRAILCRQDDAADCYWVICQGHVRVERIGAEIVLRGPGEVVGEQAFYRKRDNTGVGPRRGACLRASGSAKVLRIDRSVIDAMSFEERAVWHETLARVQCHKLDQATDQRQALQSQRSDFDGLIQRFVCSEGREAALAALDGNGSVAAHQTDAVVWFSDIKGFSAYAANLQPSDVAATIRLAMNIQAEEIAKAAGQIDKFMGDGLMAFWLCPDVERLAVACEAAATAALQAASRLRIIFETQGLPLGIRMGIHAGPAVFGDFGGANRIAFTCAGRTVNDASRYEQASVGSDGLPLGIVRLSPIVFEHITSEPLRSQFGERRTFEAKHLVMFETHTTAV